MLFRSYVVFMDLPAVWDLALAEQTGLPIRWDPGYGARLGVMPREGSDADVTWYEIDPCYVFHPLNAFEDGSDIVLDVCRKDHVMHGEIDSPASLHRWRIHTDSGRVSETPLDDRSTEFPRVCDSVVGLPYRYGYAAGLAGPVPYAERYIKYDMDSGASLVHELGAGREGSEAVFVRDPARAGEDAGWLLSYVYNKDSNTSEVLILDAGTMDAEPVAQIKLPARVPMGFHGSWVPF